MPDSYRRSTNIHLAALILIALTGGFATALILITGELMTLWPIYVVPIVIAAITHHVAGAVLVSAICSALLLLMLYGTGEEPAALPELIVGMGAFTVSGVVIGWQAHRSDRHGALLEDASIFDPLTGLYKRAYLDKRIYEELRRSERYGLVCSLVLVEVERFDEFKERFGHYKAEMLLEHLGDVLRVSVRDHDIVGRYDAISFAIVMPFTGDAEADAVAKRMREVVDETEFEGDVLEPATGCSVRTSRATFPDDACARDTLLEIAEDRLEEAAR